MSTLSNPADWLLKLVGAERHYRAPKVTPSTALEIAAVWYANNKICGDLAQMPLEPYRRDPDGSRYPDVANPWWRVLRQEANNYMTAHAFKETISQHALMWGDGRAVIWNGEEGLELLPLMPDRTWTLMVEGIKYHVTRPDYDERLPLIDQMLESPERVLRFTDDQVLHVMGFTDNGLHGMSVVEKARRSMSVNLGQDARAARQANKGFTGNIMLEAPPHAFRKEEDAKEFLEQFKKMHTADNEGEAVGLLRDNIKANVMSMPNTDAQFLQSREFQRQEVMLWFGLESMPGDKDSVSYNSLEQKQQSYLTGTLSRWMDRWTQACDKALRTEAEKRENSVYFRFNTGVLLRADTKSTLESLGIGITSTIMSPNEAREKLDMNPRPGGDEFYNPNTTAGNVSTEADTAGAVALLESDGNQDSASVGFVGKSPALAVLFETVLQTEVTRVENVAKKDRTDLFAQRITKLYAEFEGYMADYIERVGGDRGIAADYCTDSKKTWATCVNPDQDKLKANVAKYLPSWVDNRAGDLVARIEESCSK